MRRLPLLDQIDRLEDASSLDPLVKQTETVVTAALRPRWLRDILHGVPLGHPLHPLGVHVPLGGVDLSSRARCDALHRPHSSHSDRGRRRRSFGHRHSRFRRLVEIARTAEARGASARCPQYLAPLDEIAKGERQRHTVHDVALLVVRQGEKITVLANTCSHLSAPLDEGTIVDTVTESGVHEACVECPWHQSVLSLQTGEVVHGPATSPQPRFDTRVVDGIVEIRLPNAG